MYFDFASAVNDWRAMVGMGGMTQAHVCVRVDASEWYCIGDLFDGGHVCSRGEILVGSLDGLCHFDDGGGGAFIELWLRLWSCWVRAFNVALTLLDDLFISLEMSC